MGKKTDIRRFLVINLIFWGGRSANCGGSISDAYLATFFFFLQFLKKVDIFCSIFGLIDVAFDFNNPNSCAFMKYVIRPMSQGKHF